MQALHLYCAPDEVDAVSAELWEAGTAGIQEIDHPENVALVAGFEDESRGRELLERFARYQPVWEQQPEVDWIGQTEAAWPPREIGERLFLAPRWFSGETPPGRVRIVHNPGAASGTGEHPCTQLALEALERMVDGGESVFDIGTGSGILSVAALRLGARFAAGVDVDTDALITARENFGLNGLVPTLVAGTVDCLATLSADIIVANISGSVLLSIFDDLLRIARPDAYVILTGFTDYEVATFQNLLPGAEVTLRDDWRCVCAQVSHGLSHQGV
jgi:ribosomal protein L11 methyltransferase